MDEKECIKCHEIKDLQSFGINKGKRRNVCKKCCSNNFKKWTQNNMERYRVSIKRWKKSNLDKVRLQKKKQPSTKRCMKKWKKKQRELLSDSYIIEKIRLRHSALSSDDIKIYPDVIENERLKLAIKRLIFNNLKDGK